LFLRLGLCYLDLGKDKQADRNFLQAFELGQSSGNYYAAQTANYGRMIIARRHGRLNAIADIYRQSLRFNSEKTDQQDLLNGIALIMAGSLSYERNDLSEARRLLVQGLEMTKMVGIAELLIKGHFALTCLKIAKGEQVRLPDLDEMAENSSPGLVSYAAALSMRLLLLRTAPGQDSDFSLKATRWAESQQLNLRYWSSYDWEMHEKLIYARVLCRQYQAHPSERLKARLVVVLDFIKGQVKPLEALNWWGISIEVHIVLALILYILKRKSEALSVLERALDLAEPQGYIRTFVDEGQPMQELLHQMQAKGIHEVYTRHLLAAFDGQKPSHPSLKADGVIEPLTVREMQVLRLLNTQLSVPEIAAEIHLSPTTVRTHVQHIYQKFGVHGRIEALQKAERIGLL
jgi:LuxR family maltose regulon positive regulatory protein